MSNITLTDLQQLVHDYIVAIMNASFNPSSDAPYGSDRGLSYCNNAMLEAYNYVPPESLVSNYISGNIARSTLANRIRILGAWYARSVFGIRGLTGTTSSGSYDGFVVPFSETYVFFVQPQWHQDHYDTTVAQLNADAGPTGPNDIRMTDIIGYLTRIKNIIINNIGSGPTVDLRVCHSSCHSNCHGSRGRR